VTTMAEEEWFIAATYTTGRVNVILRDRDHGPWKVLEVDGELDLHTSSALRDRLSALVDDGARRIAVDLSAVPFMDSSSLGVLVVGLKRLREHGGELALIGVGGSPRKVLSITGMDGVFAIYEHDGELPGG
jgi:anti-sigma B factor antagonist